MTVELSINRELERVYAALDTRTDELGLERYDPADIIDHPLFLNCSFGARRYLLYPIKLLDHFFPIQMRALLSIRKRLVPSVVPLLGNAALARYAAGFQGELPKIHRLAQLGIDIAEKVGATYTWTHPFKSHGLGYKSAVIDKNIPQSCLHNTARMGLFYSAAATILKDSRYTDVACGAARGLVEFHNWKQYADGAVSVSYYPYSSDEIINTAAEAGALISALPDSEWKSSQKYKQLLDGIARFIVREVRKDGLWNYETTESSARSGGDNTPDIYHNAMVIASIARIAADGRVSKSERDLLLALVEKSVRQHLNAFYPNNEKALMFPKSPRPACISGYCETVLMLHSVADLMKICAGGNPKELTETAAQLLRKCIDALYLDNTADVACYARFGYNYNMRSIRWGSGLLMYAIAAHLLSPKVIWRRDE